jgi:peptidoglycan/LPS O-acetylase OafA/YrhL
MFGHKRRISDLISNNSNSFSLLRLIAALLVVLSHSCLFVDENFLKTVRLWSNYELGQHAVNAFFSISGLLICQSYYRSVSSKTYIISRILRIYPALVCSSIVVGWLFGALTSSLTLSDYFSEAKNLYYPIGVLLYFNKAELTGAFHWPPYPSEVNSPLWTIKYEIACYICLMIGLRLKLLEQRIILMMTIVLVGCILVYANMSLRPAHWSETFRFGLAFLIGVAAYQYRYLIVLRRRHVVILAMLCVILSKTVFGPITAIFFVAYASYFLASGGIPFLSRLCNEWDISFGIYIYSWPIQKIISMHFGSRLTVIEHAALSLAVTLPFAILSWIVIEKPALRLKYHFRKGSVEKTDIVQNIEVASEGSIRIDGSPPYATTKNLYQ